MKTTPIIHRFVYGVAVAAMCCLLATGCSTCKENKKTAQCSPCTRPITETVEVIPLQEPTITYSTSKAKTTTEPAGSGTVNQSLPSSENLQRLVNEAHQRFQNDNSGKNADYIPYLATVPSKLFGVAIVTADGRVFTAGDVD